jgi:hypothetical protein
MNKDNVAVCPRKFEKFVGIKVERAESRSQQQRTHDNPPFTVVMLVNILFSED